MTTQENKTQNTTLSKKKAIEELWRRGNLSFLLDSNQESLYKLFHESNFKIQTWLISRRSGKSYSLCVMSIEQCLRKPNSIVKFLSPTKKQVERNIRPLMTQILESCPEDLRPELKSKDDIYYFPNGSEIQMAGSEMGNIDSLRGGYAHICVIDEAQDVTNLSYAINSVLLPTTATTKGKILLAGTPPTSYDHEFITYVEKAEIQGSLIRRTWKDNPRIDIKEMTFQAESMGGFNSESFRREFCCEIIPDSQRMVIPEFTEDKQKDLVKEWPRPPFYVPVTSMDLGFRDWTFVVFGYFDFRADKLIIEDEIVLKGNELYLKTFGEDILKKEEELWVADITKEVIPVKKRVSDHDLIVINELKKNTKNRLLFEPADKNDRMAGINFIRNLIKSDKLIIHPRCKYLIHHLKNAKWDKHRDKFLRCPEGSHYDGVAALVYLARAINYSHNPYPKDYGSNLRISDTFILNEKNVYRTEKEKESLNIYKKILGKSDSGNSRRDRLGNILTSREENIKKYYK